MALFFVSAPGQAGSNRLRVISMSPSITELLYALGADSFLVANTKYCKFPPQTDTLPEVGGYLDPNFEAIVALEPDLILLLKEQKDVAEKSRELGIKTLMVNHQTMSGILESYQLIGAALGVTHGADSLTRIQSRQLAQIADVIRDQPVPRVLVVIGHNDDSKVIKTVTVAGREKYYSDMIAAAGGVNAITDSIVRYPQLSPEGLSAIDPDIIIDLYYAEGSEPIDSGSVQARWRSLPHLQAVKNKKVFVLEGAYLAVPGPRFVRVVREFARVIHPEVANKLPQ